MAAVQHRATTRTSNTDNSTTKTKSKATSARKSPATKRKRVSAETARAAAALKGLAVEAPAPSIEANEPGQFGRINVMDITPAEERGIFPARVELGEPFEMTAQVFIEGRTKVGATAIVRNPRGKETMRRAMTCVNPGLDRWTVMVKCGEHSDLKPWEDGYAAVKRQLGEWTVTIEGWEDAYVSWLHDARIKVRVMDDVDNALNSGAELLARWAETPDTGLTARDRKTLEKAAETMADQTLSAEDRLAAGDNPTIAALHETHPLRDGISPSQPQRFKVERPKSSFAAWYQFFPRSEGATIDPNTGKIKWHIQTTPADAWDYDGVNEAVLADLKVEGKTVPALLKADRNGFFFVANRETGKVLSAEKFVPSTNWAKSWDIKTMRAVEDPDKRPGPNHPAKDICPNLIGGKNWQPMSFNPNTGLVYIPTNNVCMDWSVSDVSYKRGVFYLGAEFPTKEGPGGYLGELVAWDPVKQKKVWGIKEDLPFNGGTLTTGGNLVFSGNLHGDFRAINAKDGKVLWKKNLGSGIGAGPVTYSVKGKQYVAIVVGRTASIPAFLGDIGKKMTAAAPEGGSLFVFALQ